MTDSTEGVGNSLPKDLGELVLNAAVVLEPKQRLTVAEAGGKTFMVHSPPAYIGLYKPDETPYMTEPMNMTMSRDHTGLIFVGPAQSGKTISLILVPMMYFSIFNPMDLILYHMSKPMARDFSMGRIDRAHRHTPEWGTEVMLDNTYDKTYKSGMRLLISYPSINEMSSRAIPIVMFTDYDRMPQDVDGEGTPFPLGQKRTTTFRNLGMTIAESSPGFPVEEPEDHDEERAAPGEHEAPPCKGILGLYNQGDRRLWYWPCPECGEYFEGRFLHLKWPTKDEDGKPLSVPKMASRVKMVCPHCDCRIAPEQRDGMNARGVWLAEGQTIDKDGHVEGESNESKTLSYWLKGPAARYTTWRELVKKYLDAERVFERTGSEDDLKVTVNTDQGEPYVPRARSEVRQSADLQARANTTMPHRKVPRDVVALFALMDTQKYRWEVQIVGVRPGKAIGGYDFVVIDRYKLSRSERFDEEGVPLPVQPASYPEDWDLIVPEVMDKTYELEDGSGHMEIAHTFCDSGGSKARTHGKKTSESEVDKDMSVTSNAYNFWRRLRKTGKAERMLLIKGNPNINAPRAEITYPDSKRSDRNAGAAGEIPVLFINVNSLKDSLNAMLDRTDPGGGMIDFPSWLPIWWFEELTAEVRGRTRWEKVGSRNNEAWDLLVYALAAAIYRKLEKVDWAKPPGWLAPWDENVYVVRKPLEGEVVDKKVKPVHRFSELGAQLA